ncbi:prostatic acid phosphatase-like [Periplaneta americana]|uniref:prostatic acid phosphatase-like n=1 Tax=Periplaneta americana TaxID=6978 RepID=UPI0037E8E21E
MLANFLFSFALGLMTLENLSRDIFVLSVSEDEDSLGSLLLVNIIFRHGDRSPVSSYPTDPYNNVSYWPAGWGQLTNAGKQQQYELGQWLRKRYSKFLPEMYNREDIFVRSTDVDRTLMSAESNLAGLYPPRQWQKWSANISWQPIPIHTVPENMDQVLAGERPCPRYNAEMERVKSSPEMKRFNEEHAELYKYISEKSGAVVHDPESLEYIYNTLFIEDLYNLTLPNWTKEVYPDKMKPVASFSFTVPAKTKLLQRLKIGPLMGEMVKHMIEKRDGVLRPNYKMFMYSGHDVTIANFLMALGVFDPQSPPYRALIMVELWKTKQGKHKVMVYFRNSTAHEPYNLIIPGCQAACPLDDFARLLKPVIPFNWEKECKKGLFSDDFAFNSLAIIALMVSGILAVLLLLSMVFGITYWKKQRMSSNYYYHRLHQDVS